MSESTDPRWMDPEPHPAHHASTGPIVCGAMTPLTPESEALLALWEGPDPSDGPTRDDLAAIEQAAVARYREALGHLAFHVEEVHRDHDLGECGADVMNEARRLLDTPEAQS